MQALFTSRLLAAMDLRRAFFILPAAALIGAVLMLAFPGATPVIAGIGIYMLARLTIHDSAIKSLESLIPEERRGRASTFLDGYLPAVGVIGGADRSSVDWSMDADRSALLYLVLAAAAGAVHLLGLQDAEGVRQQQLNWRLKRR